MKRAKAKAKRARRSRAPRKAAPAWAVHLLHAIHSLLTAQQENRVVLKRDISHLVRNIVREELTTRSGDGR